MKNSSIPTLDLASELHKSNQLGEAIKIYDQIIRANKNDVAEAYIGKGYILDDQEKYEEAILCYDQAIKLNPQNAIVYNAKAITLNNLGKYQAAILCFDKAIEYEADNPIAYNNKAISLSSLGKYKESIELFKKAIELDTNYENAIYNLALNLNNFGQYDEAIDYFNLARELNPQNSNIYYQNGVALHETGDYEAAKHNFFLSKQGLNNIFDLSSFEKFILKSSTNIKYINFNKRALPDAQIARIISLLEKNRDLEIIDLSFNQFSDTAIIKLAEFLKNNTKIKKIYLAGNNITNQGAEILLKLLDDNNNITSIIIEENHQIDLELKAKILQKANRNKILQDKSSINFLSEEIIRQLANNNPDLTAINLALKDIQDEGVKSLTQALKSNQTVDILDLKANNLTNVGAQYLIDLLRVNQTITEIKIDKNEIEEELKNKIISLTLRNKILKEIKAGIKLVDLHNTDLQLEEIKTILEYVDGNENITEIDIGNSTIGDKGAQLLLKCFNSNRNIISLKRGYNDFSGEFQNKIIAVVTTNVTLKNIKENVNNISLSQKFIGLEEIKIIFDALSAGQKSISEIDLSKNNMSDEAIERLTDFLKINPSLTKLNLNSVKLSNRGLIILIDVFKNNQQITEIDFSDNDISDEGAEFLAEFLKTNQTLKKLNIKGNKITSKGLRSLDEALKANSSLDNLDFIFNINAESLTELSRFFSNKKALDFQSQRFGDQGAIALANILKDNQIINKVNLYFNSIGEKGVLALSTALKSNSSLFNLDLTLNTLSDIAIKSLCESIKYNHGLINLSLSHCSISNQGAHLLIDALIQNGNITWIGISNNSIDNLLENDIYRIVERNKRIQEQFVNLIKSGKIEEIERFYILNPELEFCKRSAAHKQELLLAANNLNQVEIWHFFITNGLEFDNAVLNQEQEAKLSELEAKFTLDKNSNLKFQKLGLVGKLFSDKEISAIEKKLKINFNKDEINDEIRNHIISIGLKNKIIEEIKLNPTSIDLHDKRIQSQEIKLIFEALADNKTISAIDLGNNPIGDEGAEHLIKCLESNPNIIVIDRGCNFISLALRNELFTAISLNSFLKNITPTTTEINLSSRNIKLKQIKVISKALADNNKSILKINLSKNSIDDEGLISLLNSLQSNQTITELDLSENNISKQGAKYLADFLKTNKTLKKLSVNDNKISAEGLKAIDEALKDRDNIDKFNLEVNINLDSLSSLQNFFGSKEIINFESKKIGDVEAEAFSKVLLNNKVVKEIILKLSNLGPQGAQLIFNSLHSSQSFIKLNISYNRLGSEGIEALAKLIKNTQTIQNIDLRECKIGDKEIEELAEAIAQNNSITYINFYNCSISEQGGKILAKALTRNHALVSIDVSCNNMGSTLQNDIRRVVNRNQELQSKFVELVKKGNLEELQRFYIANPELRFDRRSLVHKKALFDAAKQSNKIQSLHFFIENGYEFDKNELSKEQQSQLSMLEAEAALNKALKTITESQEILNLSNKYINFEKIEKIAIALISNYSVTEIKFEDNQIDNKSAEEIIKVLEKNYNIIKIDLDFENNNSISTDSKGKIISLLKRNYDIQAHFIDLVKNSTFKELNQYYLSDENINFEKRSVYHQRKILHELLNDEKINEEKTTKVRFFIKQKLALDADLTKKVTKYEVKLILELIKSQSTSLNIASKNIGLEEINEIALALNDNSSVIDIDLSDNNLTDDSLKILAETLEGNQSITKLNLQKNNLTNLGARSLIKAFEVNQIITEVNIEGNEVSDSFIKKINELTARNKKLFVDLEQLKILQKRAQREAELSDCSLNNDLSDRNLSAEDLEIIVLRAARQNNLPANINLADNEIGDKGAIILSALLRTDASTKILDVEDNGITDLGATAIFEALAANSSLNGLNIGSNQISSKAVLALSDTLEVSNSLLELDLSNNNLGHKALKSFFITLGTNESVIKLNLSGNNLGNQGSVDLGNALESNDALQDLNLANNNIGNKGVKAIARALEINHFINKLSLEANNVGAEGISFLAQLLSENKTITELDLGLNQIEAAGIKKIVDALKGNNSIISLNLGGNNIRDEGALLIIELLKTNHNLTRLNISYNNISEELDQQIKELIIGNQQIQQKFIDAVNNGNLPELEKLYKNFAFNKRSIGHQEAILKIALDKNNIEIVKFFFAQGFIATKNILEYAREQLDLNESKYTEKSIIASKRRMVAIIESQGQEDILTARKDNKSSTDKAERKAGAAIKILKNNTLINHISLRNLALQALDIKEINEILKTHYLVNSLNLSNTGILALTIKPLIECLKTNKSIYRLNLSANTLRDDGGKNIAELIGSNSSIIDINISSADIGTVGIAAISGSLEGNYNITSLNIAGNRGSVMLQNKVLSLIERNNNKQKELVDLARSGNSNGLENLYKSIPGGFNARSLIHQKEVIKAAIENSQVLIVEFFINQEFKFDKEILKYAKTQFKKLRIESKKQDQDTKNQLLKPFEEIISLVENSEVLFTANTPRRISALDARSISQISQLDSSLAAFGQNLKLPKTKDHQISFEEINNDSEIKEMIAEISNLGFPIFLSYPNQQYDWALNTAVKFEDLLPEGEIKSYSANKEELRPQDYRLLEHSSYRGFIPFIDKNRVAYFKDETCLRHLRKALKKGAGKNIFPIIYQDEESKDMDITVLAEYIKYLQEKYNILQEILKSLDSNSKEALEIVKKIKKLDKNKAVIIQFINIVDKNTPLKIKALDVKSTKKLLKSITDFAKEAKVQQDEEKEIHLTVYLKSLADANDYEINYIARNIKDEGVKRIYDFLSLNKVVEKLVGINLSANNISNEGAQIISKIIKKSKVTDANLSDNKIKLEGLSQIAESLQGNQLLTTLNLSQNPLGDKASLVITKIIENSQSLTSLSLNKTQIGDKALEEIAQGLKTNISLKLLDLSSNKITDQSAQKLAELIEENDCLTELDLSDNKLTDEGAKIILQALKKNKSIININLDDNLNISKNILDEIKAVLQKRQEGKLVKKLREEDKLLEEMVKSFQEIKRTLNDHNQKLNLLEARVKSVESRVNILETRVYSLEETKQIVEKSIQDISYKIAQIAENEELLKDLRLEREKLVRRKEIIEGFNKNSDLQDYFLALLSELEAIYIASQAIATGEIDQTQSETYSKAAGFLGVAASLIPVIGNIASKTITGIGLIADSYENATNATELARIRELSPTIEIFDKIAVKIAVELTLANEGKITSLQQAEVNKNWKSYVKSALSEGLQGAIKKFIEDNQTQAKLMGRVHAHEVSSYFKEKSVIKTLNSKSEIDRGLKTFKSRESVIGDEVAKKVLERQSKLASNSTSPISARVHAGTQKTKIALFKR
jgi:Ran GTPase-activating protein (RanGAP) involved in mRNA processing and transport/Flp pilus assembly protein TadD